MTHSVSRRRWAGLVLAVTLALFGSIVIAAPGAVSALEPIVVDSTCSLRDAVRAANNGSTVGGCENSTASTLIHIAPEATPSGPGVEINSDNGPVVGGAQTALPRITADITIDGLGNGIYFAWPIVVVEPYYAPRLAVVDASGSLSLRDITIAGFEATGTKSRAIPCVVTTIYCLANDGLDLIPAGDVSGGVIYAEGDVNLDGVVAAGNSARGGSSGRAPAVPVFDPFAPRAPSSGADAYGGVIYSTARVEIDRSVFVDNRVVGGASASILGERIFGGDWVEDRFGGSGGSAYGADIALSDLGAASITNSLFLNSSATGGNGRYGTTDADVKALIRAPMGADGADGFCDSTPTLSEASSGDGVKGGTGTRGSDGGSGGNAVGSISGPGSVTLHATSFVGSEALAGTAGEAGIPGRGGIGGDGGTAYNCLRNPGSPVASVVNGVPGDPGGGGDHGDTGRPGDRGFAVSAVSVDHLVVVNTTFDDTSATVPADAIEPDFPNREDARSTVLLINGDTGQAGCVADESPPDCGSLGVPGAASAGLEDFELNADPGGAFMAARDGTFATFLHSTIAGVGNSVGPQGRRAVPTGSFVVGSPTSATLDSSIVTAFGGAQCPSLVSNGANVIDDDRCIANADRLATDASPVGAGPLEPGVVDSGAVLATDAFGGSYQMKTRRPTFGPPLFSPIDRGTCELTDGLDARRAPRSDGGCDAGAHERNPISTYVFVFGGTAVVDPLDDTATTIDIAVAVEAPNTLAPAFDLEVSVSDFDGLVDFGEGPTADRTHVFEIAAPYSPDLRFLGITLLPDSTTPPNATITATLDTFPGDPGTDSVTESSNVIPIVYEPSFEVDHLATTRNIARCSTDEFIFSFEPDGRSVVPNVEMVVTPNGTPTPGADSGTATSEADGVHWSPGGLASASDSKSLTVVVDASTRAIGSRVTPQVTYANPAGGPAIVDFWLNSSRRVVPDTTFAVTYDGLAGINPGETRTVTATIENLGTESCSDVTAVDLNMVASDDSGPLGAGDTLDRSIGDLAAGATTQEVFSFTAPATEGPVTFDTTVAPFGAEFIDPITFSYEFDVLAPTMPSVVVSPAIGQADPTDVASIDFGIVFEQPVDGFVSTDVLIGGTAGPTSVVVTGAGTDYEAVVSGLTGDGTVTLNVPSEVAQTDDALGNLESNTAAVVYDTTGPVATIDVPPSQGASTATTPVVFVVEFDEPVDGFDGADIVVAGSAGATAGSVSGSGSSYEVAVDVVPASGTVTLDVLDAAVVDALGNASTSSAITDSVLFQTVAGAPTAASAAAGDQQATVTWLAPVDDGDSAIVGYQIETSTEAGVWAIGVADTGSADQSAILPGLANDVPVQFRVSAINGVGLGASSDPTEPVTPTEAPGVVVLAAAGQASPTSVDQFSFTATFSQPVTGFDEGDVFVRGMAGSTSYTVSGSGADYEIVVDGVANDGTVEVSVVAGAATNENGQPNVESNTAVVVYDTTGPTVTIAPAPGQPVPPSRDDLPLRLAVTFDEPTDEFDDDDIVAGGTAGAVTASVTGAGTDYVVEIDVSLPTAAALTEAVGDLGTLELTVVEGAVTDDLGNASQEATFSVTLTENPPEPEPEPEPDVTPPVIEPISTQPIVLTSGSPGPVDYEVPAVSDDSGTADVTCDPPPGSTFAVGSHEITCTAVDAAGNTSTSTFTLMVSAAALPPTGNGSLPIGQAMMLIAAGLVLLGVTRRRWVRLGQPS